MAPADTPARKEPADRAFLWLDDMIGLFFSATTLGLAFAAPPGPVTAEAVRRGLAGGFWRSFMVGIGSLIGDSFWAVVALAGAAFVVDNDIARIALGSAGVLWLSRLAVQALRAARSGESPKSSSKLARRSDFAVGAVAAFANPYVAGFWLAVGGGVTATLVESGNSMRIATFFTGFLAGCIVWCVVISYLVGVAHRRVTTGFLRGANLLAGVVLGGFAILLLWRLVSDLA